MFIRSERLLLRPGWPEDAQALADAIGDEGIVRNLARAPWPYGVAEATSYLASFDVVRTDFLICERGGTVPIGAIGLSPVTAASAELGYWLTRRNWNRGYVTEAGQVLIRLAKDGLRLRRIVAGHFINNAASGRVLQKLGFSADDDPPVLRYSAARGTDAAFKGYRLELDDPTPTPER